jgi:hypothetical protein
VFGPRSPLTRRPRRSGGKEAGMEFRLGKGLFARRGNERIPEDPEALRDLVTPAPALGSLSWRCPTLRCWLDFTECCLHVSSRGGFRVPRKSGHFQEKEASRWHTLGRVWCGWRVGTNSKEAEGVLGRAWGSKLVLGRLGGKGPAGADRESGGCAATDPRCSRPRPLPLSTPFRNIWSATFADRCLPGRLLRPSL